MLIGGGFKLDVWTLVMIEFLKWTGYKKLTTNVGKQHVPMACKV